MTVVIPAMNEKVGLKLFFINAIFKKFKDRLPVMLDECLEYLAKRLANDQKFSYEVF